MQTDEKGILTNRPPNPFHKSDNLGHGQMSRNEQPEFGAFEEEVQAALAHLAKVMEVMDEKLIIRASGIEATKSILTILSARHQEELQEAVKQAHIEGQKTAIKWVDKHNKTAKDSPYFYHTIWLSQKEWQAFKSGEQPKTTDESSKFPKK